MAAAVLAGIPLNVRFAHIHGGESTLGAIDNIYRHTITLASKLHFVSTEKFADRIRELNGPQARCIVTGSLSLDNLKSISFLSIESFLEKWGIDLTIPSILTTIHPETVDYTLNETFARESVDALSVLTQSHQVIITMPNADTSGTVFRNAFNQLYMQIPGRVYMIENFGTQSYFTCMKYVDFLLGNTSSGIIEAASFGKYVINVGNRQKGRLSGKNVLHVPFNKSAILEASTKIAGKIYTGTNIYFKANASQAIIRELKSNVF
jgi:GDP/UDP-N,N'-diacetylbacillosamine 2-epimerase (hydrolysing)